MRHRSCGTNFGRRNHLVPFHLAPVLHARRQGSLRCYQLRSRPTLHATPILPTRTIKNCTTCSGPRDNSLYWHKDR
eukprot:COSAG01_NODE_3732_length_5753_cov_3.662894_4_plen_76_part_00